MSTNRFVRFKSDGPFFYFEGDQEAMRFGDGAAVLRYPGYDYEIYLHELHTPEFLEARANNLNSEPWATPERIEAFKYGVAVTMGWRPLSDPPAET